MSPFTLYVGCGDCGGDMERIAGTPFKYEGLNRDINSVLRCKRCHHLWVVRSEMLRAPADAMACDRQRKARRREAVA